jgi:hypothetical protein
MNGAPGAACPSLPQVGSGPKGAISAVLRLFPMRATGKRKSLRRGGVVNKYLMMTAAALIAAATPGLAEQTGKSAGSATFFLTTGNGGSYCNYLKLQWENKLYHLEDVYDSCGSGYAGWTGLGLGIAGRTKGFGRHVLVSDYSEPYRGGSGSDPCAASWDFPLPIKDSEKITLYSSCFSPQIFHYRLNRLAGRMTSKSVSSRIREMMKQHASAAKKAG